MTVTSNTHLQGMSVSHHKRNHAHLGTHGDQGAKPTITGHIGGTYRPGAPHPHSPRDHTLSSSSSKAMKPHHGS
jgi:hypothetical protein